jgi:hypothetical protein
MWMCTAVAFCNWLAFFMSKYIRHGRIWGSYAFGLAISVGRSESEQLYDWRFTAHQFILATSSLRLTAIIFFNWTLAVIVVMYHRLWREDGSIIYNCCWPLSAQLFSGPSPAGLMTVLTVWKLRLPQPGGLGPRIYIPQVRGDWVPFSSLPTTRRATVVVFEPASTRGCSRNV